MSILDNLTNNGWSFVGVEPAGTSTSTYYYYNINQSLQTQEQTPIEGDFTPASFRYSPSYFIGIGIAKPTTTGLVTVSLSYSDDLVAWTPITSEFLTWETQQVDGNTMKRIEATGDSYALDATTVNNQVRLKSNCEGRYMRLELTTSGDYVDSATLGINISTFKERYTGFDAL